MYSGKKLAACLIECKTLEYLTRCIEVAGQLSLTISSQISAVFEQCIKSWFCNTKTLSTLYKTKKRSLWFAWIADLNAARNTWQIEMAGMEEIHFMINWSVLGTGLLKIIKSVVIHIRSHMWSDGEILSISLDLKIVEHSRTKTSLNRDAFGKIITYLPFNTSCPRFSKYYRKPYLPYIIFV